MNVLVSVSDKRSLVVFMNELSKLLFSRKEPLTITSTGGTASTLRHGNMFTVRDVASLTGFPEILGGRVKTLHPLIHGGLLCRPDQEGDLVDMKEFNIEPIDMVIVNLYPFANTVSKPGCTLEEAIENIDIGGPSMLRSAAKNYQHVIVVSDPLDYPTVLQAIEEGTMDLATRLSLAMKAFGHTARYDERIHEYLGDCVEG